MTPSTAPGTQGYAEEVDALVERYEQLDFATLHQTLLPLLPPPPAAVLDIGAGTGRDAAGFARLGYRVVAVEPTAALRHRAMALHRQHEIEWIDDNLPDLAVLCARPRQFDVVTLTAVWMHLDAGERQRAMPHLGALTRAGGVLALSLRHGPVPPGRRMFDVSADETIALAARSTLVCIHHREGGDSLLQRPGVTWDHLIFRKA